MQNLEQHEPTLQPNSTEKQTQQTNLKCPDQHNANQICLNQQCKNHGIFICSNQSCPCHQKHAKCDKAEISHVTKSIGDKIHQYQTEVGLCKDNIQKQFDQIIDNISDLRDRIMAQIQRQRSLARRYCLTGLQQIFVSIAEGKQSQSLITAFQSSKLLEQLKDNQIKNQQHSFLDQLKIFTTNLMTNIHEQIQKVKSNIQSLSRDHQQQQDLKNSKAIMLKTRHQYPLMQQLLENSSIVKNQNQCENLLDFFQDQVKSVKLLFKASEHDFKLKRYWEKCGAQEQTLFLVQTTQGKIIGAYSPLCHQYQDPKYQGGQGEWGCDESRTSFIFSLTQNDKFGLRNKQNGHKKAIYRCQDKKFISFGHGGEFVISEDANRSNLSKASINWSFSQHAKSVYYNENYKGMIWDQMQCQWNIDQASFRRFSGYGSNSFDTKQWEVWRVQFQKDSV